MGTRTAGEVEFEAWLDTEPPNVYRLGLQALHRAISIEGKPLRKRLPNKFRKFNVDLDDGWVTITQRASLEVIELPEQDADELEQAA